MRIVIAYYRVSTDRQGESGLGIRAQEKAVQDFVSMNKMSLLCSYVEIESGSNNSRPVLEQALVMCKIKRATLVIAKLDRLGRNVAFIASLMESRVEFIAVDMPHANHLMVHIMAAFAEHERDEISTRTKEALQQAKRRGVKLGENGSKVLSKKNKVAADEFARAMKPIITKLKKQGYKTLQKISDELNRQGKLTFQGKGYRWHPSTVCKILMRCRKIKREENIKQKI